MTLKDLCPYLDRRGLRYELEEGALIIRWSGTVVRFYLRDVDGPQLECEMFFGPSDVPSIDFLHRVNEWNASYVHPIARMIPNHADLRNCLAMRDFYFLQAGATQEQLDAYLPYFLDTMRTILEFFEGFISACPGLSEAAWQDNLRAPHGAWAGVIGHPIAQAVAENTSTDPLRDVEGFANLMDFEDSDLGLSDAPAGMTLEHFIERGPTFMTRASLELPLDPIQAIMAANEWNKKTKSARVYYDLDLESLISEVVAFSGCGFNRAQMVNVVRRSAHHAIAGLNATLRAVGYNASSALNAYEEFLLPD